jgi:hypothetical protein
MELLAAEPGEIGSISDTGLPLYWAFQVSFLIESEDTFQTEKFGW